jgi:hypothetical protein
METVQAHVTPVTRNYEVHYPEHSPREDDVHYRDFHHYHNKTKHDPDIYQCAIGKHRQDFSECDLTKPLELHHAFVEFSLQNGVDLKWLEADFPGISDPDAVGAWVESADNLEWLCLFHHRGHGGVHTAAYADFEASKYVRQLLS